MSAFDPKRTIGKRLPRNFRRTNLTRYNAFPEPGGNETLPVQGVNRDLMESPCSREGRRTYGRTSSLYPLLFDRDQSEPILLVVSFIWVRACNDGVPKCAITAFRASNRGLPKLPTTLPCATLGRAQLQTEHAFYSRWASSKALSLSGVSCPGAMISNTDVPTIFRGPFSIISG